MSLKIAGKHPSGKHKEELKKSLQYKINGFENFSPTPMKPDDVSYWKMTTEMLRKKKDTAPATALPFIKTNLHTLDAAEPVIIWFGHSSYLIRINEKNFLIDPVFSGNAAPLSFMIKAFAGSNEYKIADMPYIDYLILTHDHYDHLDYKTIIGLKGKIGNVYCSLGMSAHLNYWGINANSIIELDWWQTAALENEMQLTAAPARHFSGRGLKRGQTLWSSFVLTTSTHQLYLGGDSGYDTHFKEIGNRFGSFDIALLEAGQYNSMWPLIHMTPEETVQAAKDLNTKLLLPVHWAKFSLAMHPWDEPVKRVLAKASALNVAVRTPMIGEPTILGNSYNNVNWWES